MATLLGFCLPIQLHLRSFDCLGVTGMGCGFLLDCGGRGWLKLGG